MVRAAKADNAKAERVASANVFCTAIYRPRSLPGVFFAHRGVAVEATIRHAFRPLRRERMIALTLTATGISFTSPVLPDLKRTRRDTALDLCPSHRRGDRKSLLRAWGKGADRRRAAAVAQIGYRIRRLRFAGADDVV